MRLLLILFVLTGTMTFAQQKPPVVYKQLTDTIFNPTDRIVVGEMQAPPDPDHRLEYLAILPDNIAAYRELIRQNPLITFKVHILWQKKGAKYPAQTEAVYDSLYAYLNAPAGGDSTIHVSQMHHGFVKQNEKIKVELEVVAIAAENKALEKTAEDESVSVSQLMATIAFSKNEVLYKQINNAVEYSCDAKVDSLWIEGPGLIITPVPLANNQWSLGETADITTGMAFVRIDSSFKQRFAQITLKSLSGKDTVVQRMVHFIKVRELPEPTLYLGAINTSGVLKVSDSFLFGAHRFYAKYLQSEVPFNVQFTIEELEYNIGGRIFKHAGADMSEEVMKAIENSGPGTVILVTKARLKGTDNIAMELDYPFTWIKRSPKGTKFVRSTDVPVEEKSKP